MGISMTTALEIFANPGDLEITIGQETEEAKFAIGIFRGPGHHFRPLVTSQPFAETKEEAIKAVEGILRTVQEAITKELDSRDNLTSQYLNPDGWEMDQSKVLNLDLISRILDALRQHGVASTNKLFAPT